MANNALHVPFKNHVSCSVRDLIRVDSYQPTTKKLIEVSLPDPYHLPLPKTTPMAAEFGIEQVKIQTTDGREIVIFVGKDQGFYRESVMQIGNRHIQVQEVFVTDGKVLKKNVKKLRKLAS